MASTANRPEEESSNNQRRRLDRDIQNMISTLTGNLTHLGKSTTGSNNRDVPQEDSDGVVEHHGIRIVTLAGNNKGATMHVEDLKDVMDSSDNGVMFEDDQEMVCAFANSNYQAVNNSILLGGNYTAQDPGVHLNISAEWVEESRKDEIEKKQEQEEEELRRMTKKQKAAAVEQKEKVEEEEVPKREEVSGAMQ